MARFADLFSLFEDEQAYTQQYLDQTDDLIYLYVLLTASKSFYLRIISG